MKKFRMRMLHFLLLLTFAGAVGLAVSVNRTLSAEDAAPTDSPVSEMAVTSPDSSGSAPAAEPAAPAVSIPVVEESNANSEKAEFVGAEACAACHQDVVEAFKGAKHGKSLPKMKGVEFEKSCETCHGPGSLHAGAGGDRTAPGFAQLIIFKKLKASEVSQACFTCHKDAERSHWSGSSHDRANISCVQCHSVHSAKSEKASLVQPTQQDTCYMCHGDVKGQMRRSAHMPVVEGKMMCDSCHGPHGTGTAKLVRAQSVNQLCYQCHQDKRGPMLWEHVPVRENCLNCHHPHGSHHEKMLLAKRTFLCQRCHLRTNHPSTLYSATDITNLNNKLVGQTCQECHSNIHGSNHPSGKTFIR